MASGWPRGGRIVSDLIGHILEESWKAKVPGGPPQIPFAGKTETSGEHRLITTDADFRIYRRRSRQVVPCLMP